MTTPDAFSNVNIPLIRKIIPDTIAEELINVQPMSVPQVRNSFIVIDHQEYMLPAPPAGHINVVTINKVANWIEQQSIDMWKHSNFELPFIFDNQYTISEELFTMMSLKWL